MDAVDSVTIACIIVIDNTAAGNSAMMDLDLLDMDPDMALAGPVGSGRMPLALSGRSPR